ncbi:hypothetical protein ABZ554_43985 [Streptomyces sp. NPDC020125]|uniref:hypothetical protein n=1 Tax=Streptomyces sp. NPDC020125 TaxID=3154593 RepID=UPI00340C6178
MTTPGRATGARCRWSAAPGGPPPWRLPREEAALYLPEGSDRLHPAAAGHRVLPSRFTTALHRARCVPILMTAAR